MTANTREAILMAAKASAQTHGYNGLNFRDLALVVGIKSASIHYHFPSKADLGAAVAQRYWEDTQVSLEALWVDIADPVRCLNHYPTLFRLSLEWDNRLCLCSFMAAEYQDLPDVVKKEVLLFADVNVAWLIKVLTAAAMGTPAACERRARAIFAAIAGAQLIARSRSDLFLYDTIVESYRVAGLLSASPEPD